MPPPKLCNSNAGSARTTNALPVILQPTEQTWQIPAIDHPRRGDAGESCVRDRGVGVDECLSIVRVAVQCEQAARFAGAIGEVVIKILASGIAVELDRDT